MASRLSALRRLIQLALIDAKAGTQADQRRAQQPAEQHGAQRQTEIRRVPGAKSEWRGGAKLRRPAYHVPVGFEFEAALAQTTLSFSFCLAMYMRRSASLSN